jgi:hypothetical protein
MTNTITQFDTWHDQAPTHPTPPAIVTEAREAAARAWQAYELAWDNHIAGYAGLAHVDEARAAAIAADQWYRDVYAAWQRGDEGAIACACTPDTTCPNCKARIAANPEGVFAF